MSLHKITKNIGTLSVTHDVPHLVFLGLPLNWESNPPLVSSLQNLESSLFLIALRRYPHALVTCVAAIESVIKAKFKIPADSNNNLVDLLERARGQFPQHVGFDSKLVTQMREQRNKLSHFGFSPNDDETSAKLLLDVAFNFFDQCCKTFFQFQPIRRKVRKAFGYCDDVPLILGKTLDTWRQEQPKKPKKFIAQSYLSPVGHAVRWSTQHWSMSAAQIDILHRASESFVEYEAVTSVEDILKRKLSDPFGRFDCPVCGSDSLWCELDGGECFNSGELRVVGRSICAHCSLSIDTEAAALASALISHQVSSRRDEICRNYGVDLPNARK